MTDFFIVQFDQQHAPVISAIRQTVFTKEQNIEGSKDLDGEDLDAIHVLVKAGGEYVATGRMLADGHIGRLAVLKPHRRKTLGTKIISAFVEEAIKRKLKSIYLGAQIHATDFYKKSGFSEYGEPYFEVGIKHIYMRKILATKKLVQ